MKYSLWESGSPLSQSRPARGAWVEILLPDVKLGDWLSRPARGAWVEISLVASGSSFIMSRPARGAWVEIKTDWQRFTLRCVAPRKGRVG